MLIYIADDEKLALGMLEKTIKEWCETVEIKAFSKATALLDAAKTQIPDVVFTDIMMPGMSGLKMAESLNEISKRINIIFVTGYTEYSLEALDLFASGYVNKPISVEDVKKQMEHLRYPVAEGPVIYAKTFGNFALMVNGQPVLFTRTKAQEILAYLVDRDGSVVSRRDIAVVVFEDETYSREVQRNICNVVNALERDLEKVGASDVFVHTTHGYSINKDVLKSDYFEFLDGNKELFKGEYMEQYSFGEDFKGRNLDI